MAYRPTFDNLGTPDFRAATPLDERKVDLVAVSELVGFGSYCIQIVGGIEQLPP